MSSIFYDLGALNGLKHCVKLVDETLWDSDYETNLRCVHDVLLRCRVHF